ncbi:MAG: methyltransferase domain-containing protein [Candidatus Eremiobacteraeota bacterium]|nr:methyltransferase domain-containing protein [Candidatus Eremiobacteraeota bacterium]
MSRLLELAGAGPEEVFLDLGCGCGATNLAVASRVRLSIGVDLVPAAVEFARQAAARLGIDNARFHRGDLLHFDLSQADVMYCAATAVSEWLAQQLATRSHLCKPGARLVTVEHPLENQELELVASHHATMAWTNGTQPRLWTFFIYRKK